MDSKKFVWIGMIVGSSLGGYLPTFWGAGVFSFQSIILGTIGGALGIWLSFKISHY